MNFVNFYNIKDYEIARKRSYGVYNSLHYW